MIDETTRNRSMNKPATKHSGRRRQIIVLVDGAKNYYELPRAILERSRVSESRKAEVVAALKNEPTVFKYIGNRNIPGGIATRPFKGGRALHYAGFYLK